MLLCPEIASLSVMSLMRTGTARLAPCSPFLFVLGTISKPAFQLPDALLLLADVALQLAAGFLVGPHSCLHNPLMNISCCAQRKRRRLCLHSP